MTKRLAAEFIGTLWLVLGGCGSAVLAAAYPTLGIGFVGVALAFGLTVLTMAYAIGHVSDCHLNPAVSVGLCVGGRFPAKDVIPYIIVQVLGALPCSLAAGRCRSCGYFGSPHHRRLDRGRCLSLGRRR
jgi:aquaporin Z